MGLELQLEELREQQQRARVQNRQSDVQRLQSEIDDLQSELAATADMLSDADAVVEPPHLHAAGKLASTAEL